MRSMKVVVMAAAVLGLSTAVAGCKAEQSTSAQQEQQREHISAKANNAVPVPDINNFVAREAVAEYMKRMDQPNKLFYIYVLADTGNIIGYFVSKGPPVNICNNMTPPDKVEDRGSHDGDVVRVAPSLNGLYNAGSGVCNQDYFFDANSGGLISLKDLKAFISDQPLNLDVEPITVSEKS